jgi:hypothetical protein
VRGTGEFTLNTLSGKEVQYPKPAGPPLFNLAKPKGATQNEFHA